MMETICARKPADAFYFSESNAEAYVGSFDGLLTWVLTLMPRSVEIVEYGAQGR